MCDNSSNTMTCRNLGSLHAQPVSQISETKIKKKNIECISIKRQSNKSVLLMHINSPPKVKMNLFSFSFLLSCIIVEQIDTETCGRNNLYKMTNLNFLF